MRRVWELALLALGSLRRTPLRVALTGIGVAIATGALVSMVGFALGVQAQVEEPFQKMELVNRIDVRTKRPAKDTERRDSGKEKIESTDVPGPILDDAALERIAALPGVVSAYPDFRLESVEVHSNGKTRSTSAIGLPRDATNLRFVRDALIAGRFIDPAGDAEVVLGRKLAQALDFASPEAAIGQNLTLKAKGLLPGAGQDFRFQEREVAVKVAGVWEPPQGRYGFSQEGLVLPIDLIKTMPGAQFESALERLLRGRQTNQTGYGRVVARVARPSDLFRVNEQIQEMGYHTETLLSQLKDMRKAFVLMDLVLTAVGTVALVVAGLGIINTLLMSVLERYREIGTYKALGASDGDVRLLFLGEAGMVGLLGGAGGLALGRVVSWIIEVTVNALARNQGVDEPVMFFAFPFALLGGAMLFAVVVSLLSGVYPATRAARVDPIRALRAE